MAPRDTGFVVPEEAAGQTLAALLRRQGQAATWNEARRLIASGKVSVDGQAVADPAWRPAPGTRIAIDLRARRVEPAPSGTIVHEDAQVVVFDKPAGVSSVPWERRETGTAMDLIRAHWRAAGRRASDTPLHVVHRIDKETSGLIVFAKTRAAEKVLAARFRTHDIERSYLCVVHGSLTDRRIESRLVEDRGDGLRGSTRDPKRGKRAITHVRVLEPVGDRATLCEVRLETGKTHQIRIHLAENGHPLVGEKVYIRDFMNKGGTPLPSPRLLLHAATLGFEQPLGGQRLRFESKAPPEFAAAVAALRRR